MSRCAQTYTRYIANKLNLFSFVLIFACKANEHIKHCLLPSSALFPLLGRYMNNLSIWLHLFFIYYFQRRKTHIDNVTCKRITCSIYLFIFLSFYHIQSKKFQSSHSNLLFFFFNYRTYCASSSVYFFVHGVHIDISTSQWKLLKFYNEKVMLKKCTYQLPSNNT